MSPATGASIYSIKLHEDSELLWVEWTATVLFEGLSASCELHFWKPTLKVDAHLELKFLQHHI